MKTISSRANSMGLAVLVLFLPLFSSLAQSPQVLWFNGGSDDRGQALATDASGNIFVGGSSRSSARPTAFAVVKYSAQGAQQWVAYYQGVAGQVDGTVAALGTDSAGNIYAAGYIARQLSLMVYKIDWLVVSFAPNGTQRWAHVYNNPGDGYEQASELVVDSAAGVLYAAGITGDGTYFGWLTTKYSLNNGAVLWQRTKAGATSGDDRPAAARLDGSGNLVVLGYTSNIQNLPFKDATVVKYDPQGNVLWTRDFNVGGNSDEMPGGLVVDSTGNIFSTGIVAPSGDPEGPQVPFLVKYNSGGTQQFALVGEPYGGSSVAVSPEGNIVVAGTTVGDVGSFVRSAVTKLTPAGAQVWTTPVDGDGKVAVDADGTVYLGGTRFGSMGYDFYAAKLTSAGQKVWTQTVTEGNGLADALLAANGDFWITGTSESPTDMLTVRFPKNASPAPVLPNAPTGLAVAAGKGALTLQWVDNASNETGFKVERSDNGGAFVEIAQVGAVVKPGTKTFTDSGLNKKHTYTYRVRAFNEAGNSAYSNTASGRPN